MLRKATNFFVAFALAMGPSLFLPRSATAATVTSGSCTTTVNSNTGVVTTNSGNYCYVAFTATGTNSFTVPSGITSVDLLVIAGGGAGGTSAWGGGGGAGELVLVTSYSATSSAPVSISVGAGGATGGQSLTPSAATRSQAGFDSWVGSSSGVVAKGGGEGASYSYSAAQNNSFMSTSPNVAWSKGGNGGSGGGSSEDTSSTWNPGGTSLATTSGNRTGYGTSGGQGGTSGGTMSGGGGGGSGQAGSNSPSSQTGGKGGDGTSAASTWLSAINSAMSASWQSATSAGRIAAGGGGSGTTGGAGGVGGGGASGSSANGVNGTAGVSNTGSGGGGAWYSPMGNGGAGGSGLVVVRYLSGATVTYNYDSATGGNERSSDSYSPGGTALSLPTPTKTNFSFQGWYSDAAKTQFIGNGGASYTPTESLTLYAKWGGTGAIAMPSGTTSGFNTSTFVSVSTSGVTPALSGFTASTYKVAVSTTSGYVKLGNVPNSLSVVGGSGNATSNSRSDFVFTTTSLTDLNTALSTLQFRGADAGNSTITVEVTDSTGNAWVTGTGANNHFYEVVTPGSAITWANAKIAAESRSVTSSSGASCTGYLVTITSAEEQAYVYGRVSANSWIGASDDYNYIVTSPTNSAKIYADQTSAEGKWYWVTGPEAGTQFLTANNRASSFSSRYNNFASGEPNNSSGEHYGQMYSNNGFWNDLRADHTQTTYIVEYGDPTCTPAVAVTNSMTAQVVGSALTPTFATATSTNDGFTVQISNYDNAFTWSASVTNGGTATINSSGLVTVTGVAPYTSSTVTINTSRTNYTSGSASTSKTSALNKPSVPRNVTTSVSGTTATISWLAPTSSGGSAISKYIAYAQRGNDAPFSCNVTTGSMDSCEITGLTAGDLYSVTVVAENTAVGGFSKQTSDSSSPVKFAVPVKATVTGTIPSRITPTVPTKFVGNISDATKETLKSAGVVSPPAGAPAVALEANLSSSLYATATSFTASETVTSGSEIVLEVVPPSNTPVGTVFRGYLELTDGTLVDLGNFTLTANHISQGAGPDGFTIVPIGNYKVYLYVGDRIQQAGFQEVFGTFSSNSTLQVQPALFFGNAVNKSPGQVEVTYNLNVQAGPNGVPQLANPPAPAPTPSTSTTPTPTPSPTRTTASPTPSPEPTTEAPTPEPTPQASTLAQATPEPTVDDRGLEVVDPVADAPEQVAETTVTAVTLVAAVTAAASAAAAVAGAAGAAAGATGAAAGGSAGSSGGGSSGSRAGGGSTSSGSSSSSSSSGSSGGGEGEGEDDASLEGIDFEHDGLEIDRSAWGDNLKLWSIPIFKILDRPSHNATEKLAPITPLISKLISDGAYLRAIFGTIAAILPAVAIALGLIGIQQTGGLLLPPPAWIVAAIACIGIFDALAGFLGMFVFSVGISLTVGLSSAADVRMMLGLFIIGFGPALLAGAFRALRKPPADNFAEWWERFTDLAIAPFLGAWATKGMVEALPALAGVKLPIAESSTTIAWIIAISLIIRVLLEEFTSRFFPGRLNYIHPTDVPSPSNLQKSIALAMRAFIFWFVAGAFIGTSWHLYVGTALFIAPSYLSLFQDKFPNYPKLYQVLPSGLPGLAFTLLVASYSLSGLTAILGATPDLAKLAFVLLPIPSVILSVLGMLGREPADGDVRWYQRDNLTWLYRIGGIAIFIYTLQLTGII